MISGATAIQPVSVRQGTRIAVPTELPGLVSVQPALPGFVTVKPGSPGAVLAQGALGGAAPAPMGAVTAPMGAVTAPMGVVLALQGASPAPMVVDPTLQGAAPGVRVPGPEVPSAPVGRGPLSCSSSLGTGSTEGRGSTLSIGDRQTNENFSSHSLSGESVEPDPSETSRVEAVPFRSPDTGRRTTQTVGK